MIERKETRISDFADTNDHFADPALVANVEVENHPSKGEVGKQFQVKNGGTVDYLTWDKAPESTKMEFELLDPEIFANTYTPDISFGTMKALIGNISVLRSSCYLWTQKSRLVKSKSTLVNVFKDV